MKIIAYSEVPQKHTYIHLAYLSAQAAEETAGTVGVGLLLSLLYLFVLAYGKAAKFPLKYPRLWRWANLVFLMLMLVFFAFVIYGCQRPARYYLH